MTDINHSSHRLPILDALKGIAVFGMIAAHAIFFFHTGTDPILTTIQKILNLSVFTVFIFASGIGTALWLDIHAQESELHQRNSILRRTAKLFGLYALLAVVAFLTISPLPQFAIPLLSPPNFTEYFPFFIIVAFLLLVLRPLYQKTRHSFLLTIFLGIVTYSIGILLYSIPLPNGINDIKLLFAGGGDALRFPVLFYFPVFLIGIWWFTHPKQHIIVTVGSIILTLTAVTLSQFTTLPLLSPVTRWPPSIGNIVFGMTLAMISITLLSFTERLPGIKRINQLFATLGKESLYLWGTHLMILFLYKRFLGTQFTDIGLTTLAFLLLMGTSVVMTFILSRDSSFITIGLHPAPVEHKKKIPLPYLVIAAFGGLLLIGVMATLYSNVSVYGDRMPTSPLSVTTHFPKTMVAYITANKQWYIRRGTRSDTVEGTIRATDDTNYLIDVDPAFVTVTVNREPVNATIIKQQNKTIHFSFSSETIPPGVHTLSSTLRSGTQTVESGAVSITVSEPLLVAWTYDWEGWDVPNTTLTDITKFSENFATPFTHFISPRTFLPSVVNTKRQEELALFFQNRAAAGDELALHLHMQFDLVRAAGVTPKTSHPWGLLTQEGYDIPATDYTPDEFRTIIRFSKKIMRDANLPITGFRSGGWFMNGPLLQIIEEEGFPYDSSGRERPPTGSFRTLQWNLPVAVTPYYPNPADINTAADTPRMLLEIPNNGGNTFELSPSQLQQRIDQLITNEPLRTPKILVYVSHPQFAPQEFTKIPVILSSLRALSASSGSGPVVFVTMSDIYHLWAASQP